MQIPINAHLDFLGLNQIKNVLLDVRSSDPGAPTEGQFWYNSTGQVYKYQDATGTRTLASGGGVANAYTSIAVSGGSTVTAIGGDTLTITNGNNILGITATNAGAGADTLDFTINLTNFDTRVRTNRLDQMAAPTASVSFNNQTITNLADPTGAQDAANKRYVDVAIQGLTQKPTAAWATTAALPASTYANGTAGVGATLTGNANGALAAQDGVTPVAGDVALIRNQAAPAQNGLYVLTQLGTGGTPFILTRHVDMDTSTEFVGGFIPVESGTTNAGSLWLCTNTTAPTVGTTSITFTELNKAADLVQGTGITISGNTVSVATTYAGGTSITSLGTVTVGTWNAGVIGLLYGGTGIDASTAAGAGTARDTTHLGRPATAPANATNVVAAAGGIGTLVRFTISGTGSATSFTLTHNLNTLTPLIGQLIRSSTGQVEIASITVTDANTVTVAFNTAPANAVVYTIAVSG